MSFLLRKPARGAPPAPRAPQSHRGVASKSKQASRPTVSSSSRGGGQMQQQQLLQRRPTTTQQQRMTQSTKNKSQHVSKETQQELQSVISMEEVMEDLRVLEQQQLESQRKLAATKLTKQHKLGQQSSLESKLSSLKYANGEQRAQLGRARDVLSRSTRELGAAKLRSNKSGDALKGFDSRLKKALLSARILYALRHKVDSGIIVLRNKHCIILRLLDGVVDGLNAAGKRADDAKYREDSLRKDCQDEKLKTKNLIEAITSARSDVTALGQDLSAAQTIFASTKLRAESIDGDIVAEDKRHETAMHEEHSKLEAYGKQETEKKARDEALLKEIELKKAQVHESWKRCLQYQQDGGYKVSPEPSDSGSVPSLDVDKLQAVLEEERAALLAEETERDHVTESLTASHEEVAGIESKDTAAKEDAESTCNATERARKVEHDRREANDKFLDDLEKVRCSVCDLRQSVSELEESIGSKRKRVGDRYAEQSGTIEKRQIEVEELKAKLADAVANLQELEDQFKENQESDSRFLDKAKRAADSTRSGFEDAREQVEALKHAPDLDIQKEVEDIQQAQSILVEDTKDEIEQLCEDYPTLEKIEIDFDADKTTDEVADEALAGLRVDCDARVEQVRLRKEAERKKAALKKEREAAEHQAQLRAEMKEAEAARKRKEERRNERTRKVAKQQELDEEPSAASQKTIRFEDEEEVGSLVTNLSFGRAHETKRTYAKSRSSAHDRRESSSLLKTKSKKVDEKLLQSSLKESSHSQSASGAEKIAKSREASVWSKRHDDIDSSRDRKSSKSDSSKSRSSKSRSSSLVVEERPLKRSKDSDSVRTAGSKSKGRLSSGSGSTNVESSMLSADARKSSSSRSGAKSSGGEARDSKRDDSHSLTSHSKKSHKSSRLDTKSSGHEARDSTRDDNRSLTSQSKKSHSSSRSSTKASSREGTGSKRDDSHSLTSHSKKSHSSSRSSTKISSREGADSKRDDNRSLMSQSKKSHSSSRPSAKASSREGTHSKRDDSRSVSSQKSRTHSSSRSSTKSSSREAALSKHDDNRTVSSQKSSKSSSKRKARDSECASQASGISTMERVSKSRRRKKIGSTAGKSKMNAFGSMGDDVDFHF